MFVVIVNIIIIIIVFKFTPLRVGLKSIWLCCVRCKVWYAAHYAEHMQINLLSSPDVEQGMWPCCIVFCVFDKFAYNFG